MSGADVEREAELQAEMRKRWRHELAWSLYATSYDRVLLEMPYYQEVLARHHAAMTRSDVRTVLDVGGGTGNVTLPLLAAGRRVTVVDKSRAMLEHLRAKLEVRPKSAAAFEGRSGRLASLLSLDVGQGYAFARDASPAGPIGLLGASPHFSAGPLGFLLPGDRRLAPSGTGK